MSGQPLSGLLFSRLILLGGVYFYRVYSDTLYIFLRWFFSRCLMWAVLRDPILRVPLIYFVQVSWPLFTVRIPRRFRCCPIDWRFCWDILFPIFSVCIGEYPKVSEGQPCDWSDVQGSLVPALFHFRLMTKKFSWDGFLTLTTGLLRWPYFLVLWGKRD